MHSPWKRSAASVIAVLVASAALEAADLPVYGDSLASGWANWSWDTTAGFSTSSPIKGTSGHSISVKYNKAWAGLFLHTNTTLTASDYTGLRFSIHGGTTGGHRVKVMAYDASSSPGAGVTLSLTIAGTWSDIEIPISSLGVSAISGLVWQDNSGAAQPAFYLDEIVLVGGIIVPPDPPTLVIDAAANRHAISPYIYGMNFADADLAADVRLPVRRFGGNATTRYNWQNDTSNRASDWYFENIPETNSSPGTLPNGSVTDRFVEQDMATGTETIVTLPLIGWTPKARARACGFSVAKYGPQEKTDPWAPDCGNGVRPDGTLITDNDPIDTSTATGPSFVQNWIAHLAGRFGSASSGGVRLYNLDNEPMLWNSTHRDVHPAGTSYDEMRDRTYEYAAAVKAADPEALTLGPVLWGWTAYFYSAADAAGGGSWWNIRPDRKAHGDIPFVEWYLQQMQIYEQTTGLRILDYLDLHYYPQSGVALSDAGDAPTQAKRLRSTRSLWDPTYVDESWIGEAVRLVPRMKAWVAAHYPGTRLAVTEYNFGALNHINGALAQADVLGIFGREGLDLATLWDPPSFDEPGAFAFRIYRNYDGAGSGFGETAISAVSSNQSLVSVYAAERGDGALTVVFINKTLDALAVTPTIRNFAAGPRGQLYRYSAVDLTRIVRDADVALTGTITVELPASSVALLVMPSALLRADIDRDGDVDMDDFARLQRCLTGPTTPQTEDACQSARLDNDADVDARDIDVLRGCMSGPGLAAAPDCAD